MCRAASIGAARAKSTRNAPRRRRKLELVAQRKGNPQRVRQTFAEFFRDHYGQDVPFLSVRDFTSRWLAARKAETSPATFRRYDEIVRKFLGFLVRPQIAGWTKSTRRRFWRFVMRRLLPPQPPRRTPR